MASKSKGKVLALDWDARTLRIVYANVSKRGVAIERVLSVGIPPEVNVNDPKQLGGHIRRALKAENINVKHAVVDIPRDQAVLNTLKLPPISTDELPGVVEIQIAKELPFQVSEAAIDFAIARTEDGISGERNDVLVAAVRTEVLEHYKVVLAEADLKLDRVGLRPYAAKIAVEQLLKHGMPDRVLFLDIRPTLTEINVIREGALAFSRAASVQIPEFESESKSLSIDSLTDDDGLDALAAGMSEPGSDATPDSCVRALFMEVMRSLEAYRAEDGGGQVEHVVIGGELGVEEKLVEVIQQRLDVTAEIYNPASTFGWEPDEGAEAASFAATLGLVLGHADEGLLHFDFIHPKKVVTATEKRLKKAPLIGVTVALFLIAGVAFGMNLTRHDRATLKQLEEDIELLKSDSKDEKKFTRFMAEAVAKEEQLVWVDVLDDIMKTLPSHEEFVVEQLDMDQKRAMVKLRTVSRQRETVLNTMDKLHAFRREGRTKPRFKVTLGTRAEKSEDDYPFVEELKIRVLEDSDKKTRKKTSR